MVTCGNGTEDTLTGNMSELGRPRPYSLVPLVPRPAVITRHPSGRLCRLDKHLFQPERSMRRAIAIGEVGYWAGLAAFTSVVAYVVVQTLQIAGIIRFPLDEILIYGTSLCIVVPFVLEMLALHYLTPADKQFWTHAAVIFTAIYAVFVTANYVVQLATVIPAKLAGGSEALALLDQTPHSLFWNFDAIGYISMGVATLATVPALDTEGFEKWVRWSFIAHALVTPLISVVYFYPTFSTELLFLGFPWAITAPLFMILLAIALRKREAERLPVTRLP